MKELLQSRELLGTVAALYGAGLLLSLWRLAHSRPYRPWPKMALVLAAFALHTAFLVVRGKTLGHCPSGSTYEILIFIPWCLTAIYLGVGLLRPFPYLTAFCLPVTLGFLLAALVVGDRGWALGGGQRSAWLGFHASLLGLGYAALALAGAAGAMFLVQDRQVRHHRLSPFFMLLPPLLQLERLLGGLLDAGLGLLTVGLLCGWMGARDLLPGQFAGDPKVIWAALVWGFYLAAALGRRLPGRGGRWMARMGVAGCLFILLTFGLVNAWSGFHRH